MKLTAGLFQSSLGRKYLMAASGAALVLFVIGHLAGNLQIFLGRDVINDYGEFLHTRPALVWSARIGLLAMVGIHIWAAISLSRENRAARPVAYAQWSPTVASYASRTMLMSGLIVAVFIIYHLLHFTTQTPAVNFTGQDFAAFAEPGEGGEPRRDVYRMMVVGFGQPLVSLFYVVGVGLLCLHLSHGVSAMFQSLGLKNKSWGLTLDKAAKAISVAVFVGYASIPAAVLLGLGKEVVK
ncbi:MAG TPA: succinate:quinone oxidoreductase [Verrucomicrobiales bacterium]|nr:succinate:quinone oxidoreductase [Verrucomicrobiales bacterium]